MRTPKPLILLATLLAWAAQHSAAVSQPYPAQDIHFISAFPPGSGSDTVMRFLAEKMRPLVSVPILVENKPGAGGVIAAEASRARSPTATRFSPTPETPWRR